MRLPHQQIEAQTFSLGLAGDKGGVGYWLSEQGCLLQWDLIAEFSDRAASLLREPERCCSAVSLRLHQFEVKLALLLACLKAGVPCALVDTASKAQTEVAVALAELGPLLEFVQDLPDAPVAVAGSTSPCIELEHWLGGAEPAAFTPSQQWQDDEAAFILFTTGSTGKPKGVCHSLGNLLRSAQLFVRHFGLQAGDRLLSLAPWHTMSGLRALLIPCVAPVGVAHSRAQELRGILDALAATRATHLVCGPQAVQALSKLGSRLEEAAPRLRLILCTGAMFDEEARAALERATSVRILNYYGLTETSGLVMGETLSDRRPGCLPPLCEGTAIDLLPYEEGVSELRIAAPNLFLGYLGEPLRRRRYMDTGDLVQANDAGRLVLVGRKSQAIKAPSTRLIHPLCLETWLCGRPGVTDAVVRGVDVPGGGHLLANIHWAQGVQQAAWVAATEAAIKVELGTEYVPKNWAAAALARTPLGKIRKEN